LRNSRTYSIQHLSDAVGHDDIACQDLGLVDEELPIPLRYLHRQTEECLVLLTILERSRVSNLADDAVILECINELVLGECSDVDASPLESLVSGSEAGELGDCIDGVGEVCVLEGSEQCGEPGSISRLRARLRNVEDSI